MLPVGTILVVFSALLRIAQDFIGLVDFLELLLGSLLVLGQVGVMLSGEFPKGAFDVIRRGGFRHPKSLVVIAELCGHGTLWNVNRRLIGLTIPATG